MNGQTENYSIIPSVAPGCSESCLFPLAKHTGKESKRSEKEGGNSMF